MQHEERIYDVIVLGTGPGGMTAGLYASRSNLDTLMLDRGIPGGQLNNTADVENYTGFKRISGPDLAVNMFEGSQSYGAEYKYGNVKEIVDKNEYKEVITDTETYKTRTVIIATGAEHKKLGVPGEQEYNGRGVSYCAVCDGAFFRDKQIAVVGGGDSAVEEGTYLTQFGKKVNIIHRREELRAQKVLQDRAFKNDKVDFVWNSVVEEILGKDGKVTGVRMKDVHTNESKVFDADGVFIYIGLLPNSKEFVNLGITDEEGWILTDEEMATSVPGIYAIGDVRKTPLRQIATAVGDGSLAGNAVYNYIEKLKETMQKNAETVN